MALDPLPAITRLSMEVTNWKALSVIPESVFEMVRVSLRKEFPIRVSLPDPSLAEVWTTKLLPLPLLASIRRPVPVVKPLSVKVLLPVPP